MTEAPTFSDEARDIFETWYLGLDLEARVRFHSSIQLLRDAPEYKALVAKGPGAVNSLLGILRDVQGFDFLVLPLEEIVGQEATQGALSIPGKKEKMLEWAERESLIRIRDSAEAHQIGADLSWDLYKGLTSHPSSSEAIAMSWFHRESGNYLPEASFPFKLNDGRSYKARYREDWAGLFIGLSETRDRLHLGVHLIDQPHQKDAFILAPNSGATTRQAVVNFRRELQTLFGTPPQQQAT